MGWIRTDAEKLRAREERARAVARAVMEGRPGERQHVATTGGDPDLLRGIPVVGARGVSGAVRGSVPHRDGVRSARYPLRHGREAAGEG